jgi:hypothetical protein
MNANYIPEVGVFYHVTTSDHIAGIFNNGVDPACSTGNLKAAWYCTKNNLAWALLHVSHRHSCLVDDIYVCRVLVPHKALKRSNVSGIFYTFERFNVETISPASWFIGAEL